jgi:hypothetical protein
MKTLFGFLAGLLLAGGIAYFVVQRKSEPVNQPGLTGGAQTAAAPTAQVVETPKAADADQPVQEKPEPVRRQPAVHRAAQPVKPMTATPAPANPQPAESKPAETTVAKNEPEPAPAPAPEAPPYNPPPPPPPPKPNTVTLPAGTALNVRLQDNLASDRNSVGDAFSAVLDKPLVQDGFVIADRGARVEGRVVTSKAAGRVKGVSDIALEILSVKTSDGQLMRVSTDTWEKHGETSVGTDAAKIGGAAGIGAAIGAIAGGGKGAGIGAAIGGAAGTGGVLATRGKAVKVPIETRIAFRLKEPVTITEKLQ